MYRQGLGDCFLLSFPGENGHPAHMLIDCGVLKGTEDAVQRMQRVAQNIIDETGGHLAALVVTHEHWDHVSGFLQAEDIFKPLQIDEVWLAWTENPEDETADHLRQKRVKTAASLEKAATRLRATGDQGALRTATRVGNVLEFFGAAGRKTTSKGIGWAKDRKRRDMPFLYPGDMRTVPGSKGVRAYVLGPPANVKQLKKSDPSARNSEVYELAGDGGADFGFLAAVESLDTALQPELQPFDTWFRVAGEEADADTFFKDHYSGPDQQWRSIEHEWLGAAGGLALQLDSDTNNTSLALAFELSPSGRVLLFPGDAQVGSWLSWHEREWPVKVDGETRKVTVQDLLARTVLYKVGHHGSHNATLREKGLELMTNPDLIALLPVDRDTAGKMKWNMPFPSLYRRLGERTRGRILEGDRGEPQRSAVMLGDADWTDFHQSQVKAEDLWIDCFIEP
jgi:hypothetical protein